MVVSTAQHFRIRPLRRHPHIQRPPRPQVISSKEGKPSRPATPVQDQNTREGRQHGRRRCYPSDTWGDEWALIEPLLPTPARETRTGGRPEKHPRRELVDAIRYVVDTGCKWRALPKDFPPWRTCYGFMARWAAAGVVGQIRDHLRKRVRRDMGRAPGAVATVIDSQSVKAAETVGRDSRGYDGAKKINGRKRHMVVDTKGLPLFVMVTPADMTDRDAAKEVLFRLRLMHPEITIVWADSGYAGQLVTWAKKYLNLTLKTVSRPRTPRDSSCCPGAGSSRGRSPGSCTPAGMPATTNA